ncbi:hypothetical protein J6590_051280 [Homalodisca vitripennis]|nr:hypothetical protein J6590_051280 [Homalodisca vitripennis]
MYNSDRLATQAIVAGCRWLSPECRAAASRVRQSRTMGDTDAGIVHHSRADRPIILLHPPFTILLLIGRHILVLHPILRYTCKVVQQRRHGRGHRSSFTGRPSYHSTSLSIYNSAAHRQAYPGTSPYSTVYMQSCTTTETRTRASFIIHGQTVLSFYFTLHLQFCCS